MTLSSAIALFIAMLVLAFVPGPSALVLVSRALSSGFKQALLVALGIVSADYIFIILTVYGLSLIAESMHQIFFVAKYLGATYLLWLGMNLFFNQPEKLEINELNDIPASGFSSYLSGLLVTLGNPKAIFFYLGFFPAFVDLGNIQYRDTLIILAVATTAILSVYIVYAWFASRARKLFQSVRTRKRLNQGAGTIMVGTGAFIALKP